MHATKETAAIHVVAMILGAIAVKFTTFMSTSLTVDRQRPEPLGTRHFSTLIGVAVFVSMLCFTQGFTHMQAAWDSIATYGNYIGGRSEGQGHQKPFSYYLFLLLGNKGGLFWAPKEGESALSSGGTFLWTEAFIYAMAAVGALRVIVGRDRGYQKPLVMFIAVYSFAQLLIYSLVKYKTPWCILSAHHGFVLLAGFGVCGLFSDLVQPWIRWVSGAVAIFGSSHLALQSWRANFKDNPDSPKLLRTANHFARTECPYAYGYTPLGVPQTLVKQIEAIAARHPDGPKGLHIAIASPGQGWPLPWYLRNYPKLERTPSVVSSPPQAGLDTMADVILVDPAFVDQLPASIRSGDETATHRKEIQVNVSSQYWLVGFVKKELLGQPTPTPAPAPVSKPQVLNTINELSPPPLVPVEPATPEPKPESSIVEPAPGVVIPEANQP